MKWIFVTFLIGFLTSCNRDRKVTPSQSIAISTLVDVTDKQAISIDARAILRLFRCNDRPAASFHFRIQPITDMTLVPHFSNELQDANSLKSYNTIDDPQYREICIRQYYVGVTALIDSFYRLFDTTKPLSASLCVEAIFNEICRLQQAKHDESFIVVASDLMQLTDDGFNFYTRPPSNQAFEEYLMKEKLLPQNLDRITVIFVYRPLDRNSDRQYQEVVKLYKEVIEKRSGRVLIQSQTNRYDYE